MRYAVVIEKSETGFGAFIPDLPGCVATAETEEEVRRLIREAVELHVESLRENGEPVPAPSHSVGYVDVLNTA
jgi:predicted RNase H-like HicB family nuclease